ncbi:S-locus-specific glycoprotein S6-like [Camellia sinensis]|uniref:S-locus-specific glycoprotein S6-like n=1 Tax=Camellia sinensis TaxID=4442 RepID=UPI001036C8DB|nr:S-locus-specific glycoprotein S6-like [Camellia sinensis]
MLRRTCTVGFLSLGNGSLYVGIWYYKIYEQIVVWVANQDNPINVEAATNSSYSARLLDLGNLEVSFQSGDINESSSVVVWQSFDYPTNTILPSIKLGLDWRTGLYHFLTSWKSCDDPSTGEYFYRMDPSGLLQSFLHKGPTQLWRTGPWIGDKWSGPTEMSPNSYCEKSLNP